MLVAPSDLADSGDPGHLGLARVGDLLLASLREEEVNLVVVTNGAVDALLQQHGAHKICLCTHTNNTHTGSNTDLLAAKKVSPWKLKMGLLSMIKLPQLSQLELQCSATFDEIFVLQVSPIFSGSKISDEINI